MNPDLERMYRNPAGVKRRDLVTALRRHGWHVVRESKHQIWANGPAEVQVPQKLKGLGTVRAIIKRMIEVEEVRRGS